MSSGPKRYVQFVDPAGEPASQPPEESTRRVDLVAKINAIEVSHPALHGRAKPSRCAPRRPEPAQAAGSGKAVLYLTCLSAKLERILSMPGIGVSCSRMNFSSAPMSATATRIR